MTAEGNNSNGEFDTLNSAVHIILLIIKKASWTGKDMAYSSFFDFPLQPDRFQDSGNGRTDIPLLLNSP